MQPPIDAEEIDIRGDFLRGRRSREERRFNGTRTRMWFTTTGRDKRALDKDRRGSGRAASREMAAARYLARAITAVIKFRLSFCRRETSVVIEWPALSGRVSALDGGRGRARARDRGANESRRRARRRGRISGAARCGGNKALVLVARIPPKTPLLTFNGTHKEG